MMNAAVFGGSSGLGLGYVSKFLKEGYDKVYVFGINEPKIKNDKIEFVYLNMAKKFDVNRLEIAKEIDFLVITAGKGKIGSFEEITYEEIEESFFIHSINTINIIKFYYESIKNKSSFNTIVLTSIAAKLVSPLFSIYSASKSGLSKAVEAINIELTMNNSKNNILDICPGKLEGTSFYGKETELNLLDELINDSIKHCENRETIYIPKYNEIYKRVLNEYSDDPITFGKKSYRYKKDSNR